MDAVVLGSPWALALLAWAWAGAWLSAVWACWTGRWRGLAHGATGDAWNTFLPAHAVAIALAGVTLATGWGWPLVPAGVVMVAGLVLHVIGAFSDLTWLEPPWRREEIERWRRSRTTE